MIQNGSHGETSTTPTPTPTPIIPDKDSCSVPPQSEEMIDSVDNIDREKGRYRENLEVWCNETESLLNQLQSLEEWRSVTDHGRYTSSEILASYLHIEKWDNLRTDILDAIAESAFLTEETTKISKVSTSVRSKLYTKKKSDLIRSFRVQK